MKNRNPIAVALYTILTLGIYGIYWEVKTKGEMNKLGADIPTAWLIIVPLVNIWWLWKYSEGVEKVTGGKLSGVLAFILLWVLGFIGAAIVQDSFNNNVASASAETTEAPGSATTPAESEVASTSAPTETQPVANATPPTDPEQPPASNA